MTLVIRLSRPDPSVPWGFKIKGGIDCGQPVYVGSVVPGGLADCCGLQTGVHIISIGGDNTRDMKNLDAQQAVIRCSNDLELEVCDPEYRGYEQPSNYLTSSTKCVVNGRPTAKATLNIALQNQSGPRPCLSSKPRVSRSPSPRHESAHIVPCAAPRARESHSPYRPTSTSSQDSPPTYRQWQIPKPSNAASDKFRSSFDTPSVLGQDYNAYSSNRSSSRLNDANGEDIGFRRSILRTPDVRQRPVCHCCKQEIHGPFIDTTDHCFCPNHFTCCHCSVPLNNQGYAEHDGRFYCEEDFKKSVAPKCAKCDKPIIGQITKALNKCWHPNCFACLCCNKPLKDRFYVEEGDQVLCEEDWTAMHSTQCDRCNQKISEIDRFVEIFGKHYHASCFCCAACQTPLEGKPFHARDNKPFCRVHAHAGAIFG